MYYFSPSTQGFYKTSLHEFVPADVLPLTDDQFRMLVTDRAPDQRIEMGGKGIPFLIEAEASSPDRTYQIKLQSIDQACEKTITDGFLSSALGTTFRYSSQLDDQLNLTGAILAGTYMAYACRDELGVKAFRMHSAEQLRRVGDDFTLFKQQLLQRAYDLKQKLYEALAGGDLKALELVTWESEL